MPYWEFKTRLLSSLVTGAAALLCMTNILLHETCSSSVLDTMLHTTCSS